MGAPVGRRRLFRRPYPAARLRVQWHARHSSMLSGITSRRPALRPTTKRYGASCGGSRFCFSVSNRRDRDYDFPRARTGPRGSRALDQAHRAADLWSILTDEALAYDAEGGEVDRASLVRDLGQKHGLRFGDRPDLRAAQTRLSEAADDAIADIKDNIGGARLSRGS